MATNYERGRVLEYQARDALIAAGYFVVRSAGSKGAVDLVAIKKGEILFVQAKRTVTTFPSGEWNALVFVAGDCGARAVLAERVPGDPLRWWLLTGYKRPRQRTALPREEMWLDFADRPGGAKWASPTT